LRKLFIITVLVLMTISTATAGQLEREDFEAVELSTWSDLKAMYRR
jgi:hypothetical protein